MYPNGQCGTANATVAGITSTTPGVDMFATPSTDTAAGRPSVLPAAKSFSASLPRPAAVSAQLVSTVCALSAAPSSVGSEEVTPLPKKTFPSDFPVSANNCSVFQGAPDPISAEDDGLTRLQTYRFRGRTFVWENVTGSGGKGRGEEVWFRMFNIWFA